MAKLIKFPSIEQFRNIVSEVEKTMRYNAFDENGNPLEVEMPKLTFKGTVKLHGTNGGVSYLKRTDELWANSRKNVITPVKDNAGFADYVNRKSNIFKEIMNSIYETYEIEDNKIVTIFGEWCGGSIQKGVALNQLEKMFVIFGIKVTEDMGEETEQKDISIWVDEQIIKAVPEHKIYNINDYETFEVEIDFNILTNKDESNIIKKEKEEILKQLEHLTLKVEEECPVGKAFGVSGIGEGIVYQAEFKGKNLRFKVKGEKHGNSGKKGPRTKKTVTIAPETMKSMKDFVDYAVTEGRLNQGLQEIFGINGVIDRKKMGDFLQWVAKDVLKEETDTLEANGLEFKQVSGMISDKARKWFFTKEGEY